MTKEVLIHMKNTQLMTDTPEQQEIVESIVPGEYFFRNNSHFLVYDEVAEGVTEPTHNMVKIRDGLMEVRKRGAINTHMVFEKGKKTLTFYKLPFGNMEMEISSSRVNVQEEEELIEIHANYLLGMQGSTVADCSMNIRVTPKGDKAHTTFFNK